VAALPRVSANDAQEVSCHEMRCAVVTVAVKEHRSAKDDGWTLRARPEQHRQNAE